MNFLNKAMTAGALAVAALVAAPANAAFVGSIPGGSAVNDFISTANGGVPIEGWFNANLYLLGGPATISVQYFGAEAGFSNTFNFGGCNFSNSMGSGIALGAPQVGSTCTTNAASGLLNFSFTGLGGAGPLVNGANNGNIAQAVPNFFVTLSDRGSFDTIGGGTPGSGQVAWLFLDDGGASGDDNHDDTVIRLAIEGGSFQVPEPTSIALLGVALLGLGASRRKNAANAAK